MACLGQQSLKGKRMSTRSWHGRCLPHFKTDDNSPASLGFVKSSFVKGLSPSETFFHFASGREGLIDTAVKTSETGYITRKLYKALENLQVKYGAVYNGEGTIVQFKYGDDGYNACNIQKQPLIRHTMKCTEYWQTLLSVRLEADYTYLLSSTRNNVLLLPSVYRAMEKCQLSKQYCNNPVNLEFESRFFELSKKMAEYPVMAAYIRWNCNAFTLEGCSYDAVDQLLVDLERNWQLAIANNGEMVGGQAAQALGERSTQLCLNTVSFLLLFWYIYCY